MCLCHFTQSRNIAIGGQNKLLKYFNFRKIHNYEF